MPATQAARNEAADAVTITHVEAHSDYTGGVAVSNRQAINIQAAANGDRVSAADVELTCNPGSVARFLAFYDDPAAGTLKFLMPIGADGYRTCSVVGDTFTCQGHGFVDDDQVVVFGSRGGAVPPQLDEGDTVYRINQLDVNTFELWDDVLATGAKVTGIAAGKVDITRIAPKTDAAQYIARVRAGTTIGANPT